MVGRDDLRGIVEHWLSGKSYAEIFLGLPAVQRSSRKQPADIWMRGASDADDWSEEFDKFLDFMTSVIERYLPWLLHACTLLAPYAEGNAMSVDWPGPKEAR